MGGNSGVAGGTCPLQCLPSCPRLPSPVVRMTVMCAVLLLSIPVRQREYSYEIFMLCHMSTLLTSIVAWSRYRKACVADKYTPLLRTTYFLSSSMFQFPHFWTFRSIDFLLPSSPRFCPHTVSLHQKFWRLLGSGVDFQRQFLVSIASFYSALETGTTL